jgi:hypothetical protein
MKIRDSITMKDNIYRLMWIYFDVLIPRADGTDWSV